MDSDISARKRTGSSSRTTTSPPISPERLALVDNARKGWIRRLIDLSRRNPLLFFRDLKIGTLDCSDSEPEQLATLFRGNQVLVRKLVREAEAERACTTALEIHRRAMANLEERGLDTLFLALGFATWPASDGGRGHDAPILLVPLAAEGKAQDPLKLAVRRSGDIQINPVLLHVLNVQQNVVLDAAALVDLLKGDDPGEDFDVQSMLDRLRQACHSVQGLQINRRAIIGNFTFQKMAMVKDLEDNADQLAQHELIAAITGDREAQGRIAAARHSQDPTTLDAVLPDQEFLVLDADSSQQAVVASVLSGQDGVVHGPPGTGKSQTIANLVAELAARGKRVLFVAEKRAALDVVLERLKEKHLDHLALDLHGADLSRKEIMVRLAQSFDIVREAVAVDSDALHRRYVDARARLVAHVDRLHRKRKPSASTVYTLQGQILRLPSSSVAETRWRGPALDKLDVATVDAITAALSELSKEGALFLGTDPSPWTGASLEDGRQVQEAVDRALRLASDLEPGLAAQLDRIARDLGLRRASTLAEVTATLDLLGEVAAVCETYREAVFHQPIETLAEDLKPAQGLLSRTWAFSTSSAFRDACRRARSLRHDPRVNAAVLLAEVKNAVAIRAAWRERCPSKATPRPDPLLGRATEARSRFVSDWRDLGKRLSPSHRDLNELSQIGTLVRALAADTVTPHKVPRMTALERDIESKGAAPILREIHRKGPAAEGWTAFFRGAWLRSCLDAARAQDPELAAFNGRHHDSVGAEFRRLDEERLNVAVARVRRAHAQRAVEVMNGNAAATATIRRETERARKHMPFRKLVEEAADVLIALRPCWMASPLSVSQLLPARRYFDVVLFDEASQVMPEDAIPSILRADHAVVAGDQHQLPPTTFFAAGEDETLENEDAGATEGFESVLNLMLGFTPPWGLDWHYRSRDEALIAFSNRHIYKDRLVTFPGAGGSPVIEHFHVEQRPGGDGQEESVAAEVDRVVELILQHARHRPEESLGVIAMGVRHANRVQAAFDKALRVHRELETLQDPARRERFFIKNLERVQGDERDAIILTIGYGKDATGKLPYRFGPLLAKGGERRLNVAVTRAKSRLTLVSSFSHLDMDPTRSRARGVELLRLYLEYVASGGRTLGVHGATEVPLNDFEQDVFDALDARGIALLGQWGASRYRIDLVAAHPRVPGRFVLAIECDGATYHAAYTARDRDRLRQQHLERLGWRFHRIWSTDWFLRKADEVERAVRAYGDAVAWADAHPEPVERASVSVPAAPPLSHAPNARGPRPSFSAGLPIGSYAPQQLDAMLRWIRSDGRLRTDDELLEEAISALGFYRRGNRIVTVLSDAIRRTAPS